MAINSDNTVETTANCIYIFMYLHIETWIELQAFSRRHFHQSYLHKVLHVGLNVTKIGYNIPININPILLHMVWLRTGGKTLCEPIVALLNDSSVRHYAWLRHVGLDLRWRLSHETAWLILFIVVEMINTRRTLRVFSKKKYSVIFQWTTTPELACMNILITTEPGRKNIWHKLHAIV